MAVSLIAWRHGYWPVTLLCWVLQAHVGHANLLAFHEASHFTLHPRRWLNEAVGIFVGSVILTPLSAYRWVHSRHHAHLGTVRDSEMWPFVNPGTPRALRLLAVAGELLVGFFYTPVIFLRGVLVERDRLPRNVTRRLASEYLACLALWGLVLAAVSASGVWEVFLVGYLVPSLLSGNLQSLRKFVEHMGLFGTDVPTTTRTVVPVTTTGRILSYTMLHIDHHGPHHLHPKIPQDRLPEALPLVYADELHDPAKANVFPSYAAAIADMVRSLADPRVGAQWLKTEADRKQAARSGSVPLPGLRGHKPLCDC
jgi:fatty acid desaturase